MDGPRSKATLGRGIHSKRKHHQRLRDIDAGKHFGRPQGHGTNHAKASARMWGLVHKCRYAPEPANISCNEITPCWYKTPFLPQDSRPLESHIISPSSFQETWCIFEICASIFFDQRHNTWSGKDFDETLRLFRPRTISWYCVQKLESKAKRGFSVAF